MKHEQAILKMVQKRVDKRFKNKGLLAYYRIFSRSAPDWSNMTIDTVVNKRKSETVYTIDARPCERLQFHVELTHCSNREVVGVYMSVRDIRADYAIKKPNVSEWFDINGSGADITGSLPKIDKRIAKLFDELETDAIEVKAYNLKRARDLNDILTAYLVAC